MSSYPKNSGHERNVMGQAISLQGKSPKECHTTRQRVVPFFSSGLVERTKRECAWKSPHARNFYLSPPRLAFLAWGDFHTRLRFAHSTIPEEKWGLLVVYYTTRAPRNLSQLWNKKFNDKESFTPESDMTRVNLISRKREGHKEFYTPRNFTPSAMRYQRNHTLLKV